MALGYTCVVYGNPKILAQGCEENSFVKCVAQDVPSEANNCFVGLIGNTIAMATQSPKLTRTYTKFLASVPQVASNRIAHVRKGISSEGHQ